MHIPILEKSQIRTQIHLISVDEYHRMGEAGIVQQNVELIEGIIVEKMSKSPLHSGIVSILHNLLLKLIPANYHIRIEQPITTDTSEPEPDIAIVSGAIDSYLKVHPNTAELVIEISLSTLTLDREKANIYASANISEYWLINLNELEIEVYKNPLNNTYQSKKIYKKGDKIAFSLVPEQFISVDDLLNR